MLREWNHFVARLFGYAGQFWERGMIAVDPSRVPQDRYGLRRWIIAVLLAAGLSGLASNWIVADDERGNDPVPAAAPASATTVRFVTIGPELTDATVGRVRNAAGSLGSAGAPAEAARLLLLEVRPGAGTFATVIELAEYLTSAEMQGIRTIAWIPETVSGPRALLALACREIVMHPDAELGRMSEAASPTPTDRQRIERLLAKRVNPLVTPALAAAMLDPQASALRVRLTGDGGEPEARVVSPEELALLREAGVAVQDVRPIKTPGAVGRFSGAQAQAEGFLTSATVRDASELARLLRLGPDDLQDQRRHARAERPYYIKVEGEIQPLLTSYLKRQIERAVEQRADTVIFEIDSPGGLLQDSLQLAFAIADLQDRGIRTVAYIPRDAVSGGALISLGCDEIYLHANGKIGDAGPIVHTAAGEVHRAPEKIVSYLREYARELAEKKGRPPAVLMAMVDRELSVYQVTHRDTGRVWYMSQAEIDASRGEWLRGAMVPESRGELLLFVNGRRAHELKVAEPPVENLVELRTRLGVPEGLVLAAAEQTWLDDAVFILNTGFVTGALFFLGIILLFIELHFMVGIFGIGAALCFGVFFWSKFLGGTAGWLEVLLFLLGFACLAIEVFVIPGFGVFGVAGGMLVLGSLVMASITMNDLDSGASVSQSLAAAKSLGLAIVGVIAAGAVLSHYLPRIPILNAIILTPPNLNAPPSSSGRASERGEHELVGQSGTAVTMLRPSGKIRVAGRLLDAVSTSGFVETGQPVEVVSAIGNRITVRALTGDPPPNADAGRDDAPTTIG